MATTRDRQAEQRREATAVRDFIKSDVWEWLSSHLKLQQKKLILLSGSMGGKLSAEDRAMVCGKLALVTEVLERPSALLEIADMTERQLLEQAGSQVYRPGPAPAGSPTRV